MSTNISDAVTIDKLEVPYNPHLIVTYKAIASTYGATEESTYLTSKVTDLEWELHNGRRSAAVAAERRADIAWLEDHIPEWYDPNYNKEDVLKALAEHFAINPMKQMSVYGTVTFSGTINIPISEIEDFDLSSVTIDAELSSYDYDADLTVDDVSLEEN
jgi:hypothetical protein